MATALQQQLAVIAANSTHQLDLKAQKARHGKSLLFEPRDATIQSFDTIYQICYEGFEELCMLDARFIPFSRSLFSEQSKNEDRTQMTAGENADLDKIVASFLGLVGGRLLLKPAIKAVEWLVRRFRVQEYNTEVLILAFLPYHTSHIFPTLLSILPEQLPANFRWLHPYVASLQCPPRHAILSAATSNAGFFSSFSQYVLGVAKLGHQSTTLLGFWASITAQAINGMIESTRSGRNAIRRQREEDILMRVLPILQSALSVQGVPELYLGTCMMMAILVTKVAMENEAIDTMMEAIACSWTSQTLYDGLSCLAILAEEKSRISLPRSVIRAIMRTNDSISQIQRIASSHRTNKLILGIWFGTLGLPFDGMTAEVHQILCSEIDAGDFSGQTIAFLIEKLLVIIMDTSNSGLNKQKRHRAIKLFEDLFTRPVPTLIIKDVAKQKSLNLRELMPELALDIIARDSSEMIETTEPLLLDQPDGIDSDEADLLLTGLPELGDGSFSFLNPQNANTFKQYAAAFTACSMSASPKSNLIRLLRLGTLQKSKAADTPMLLSLLMRIWASDLNVISRVRALELATTELRLLSENTRIDFQILSPYALVALGDEAPAVRRAAANLCTAIYNSYGANAAEGKLGDDVKLWYPDGIFGLATTQLHKLSSLNALSILKKVVMPILADCLLDHNYVAKALADAFNGKDLKQSLRVEACRNLASHIAVTPVLRVKFRLLAPLKHVGKAANEARRIDLLTFVTSWVARSSEQISNESYFDSLPLQDLDKRLLGSLSHRSTQEVEVLKSIAVGELGIRPGLSAVAFQRLRELWSAMNVPSQASLTEFMLNLAVGGNLCTENVQADALETLRNLPYSTDILVYLIDTLPNAADLQDPISSTKKQRTSKADISGSRKLNAAQINSAVRRITIVLELVEASNPEKHPQLLKGLFHLLSEHHHYRTLAGSQLAYIQGMLMGCLLSLVNGLKSNSHTEIDRSVIRADLIVECVRTTSSTHVHNTALLLISKLAGWAPDLVLHSVMPLFTFMSTTLLRQSDEYSAHVTDLTVAQIVPPLVDSLKRRGTDLVSGAAELLLSFTAAYEHVPLHRRLALFRHLIHQLGPQEFLFAVVAMLADRYSAHVRILPFVSELMDTFPPTTQFRALKQYLDLIFDGLGESRNLSNVILLFGEKDAEELEDSIQNLLEIFAGLLQSPALRKRVVKGFMKGDESSDYLQTAYTELLDRTMQLGQKLASHDNLNGVASRVLSSLLSLTPTKVFIESSAQLMQTGSDTTRQQVFHSLEARVKEAKRGDVAHQRIFLDLLPNCCVFICDRQPAHVRHAAITCIDQIVEKYGKQDRAAVVAAAVSVADGSALGSEDTSLRVISILCLASMVEVLEDDFIPIFSRAVDFAVKYLGETLCGVSPDIQLYNAAFGFIYAVLDHLPWMLSAEHLDQILKLVARAASSLDMDADFNDSVKQFHALAARKVSAQHLFASIDRTWNDVATLGTEAIHCHLNLLRAAIQGNTKATVTYNTPPLFGILVKALDLRRLTADAKDEYNEVYTLVERVGLEMTLKLNDATFRPFFIRLTEWVNSDVSKTNQYARVLRATSLFGFICLLFEQLKSIVTSYASYLLESAVDFLINLNPKNHYEHELLKVMLQALSSSFNHDQDEFWQDPSHFDIIASPVLKQLEKAETLSSTDHVIPAITALASALASPEQHKAINAMILQCMRHEDAAVRLAAVKCERAMTERLTLDWLALLPEMLPFISELQEDDNEEVERETLRWVHQIEEVTGESLEGMLQ
ncbi:hypothetical protein M433DRAFT_58714 [Acidomyces richmondensis BFW]|nr:MAG: hypothetical protein FE78DRAFT_33179 [Acidomyces sp. 'richmondensis']KYG49622.1 hypothetical protein M433DRAFT_58714 [Acidomyces richmondensis BFW]